MEAQRPAETSRARAYVCVGARQRERVSACSLAYPACNSYAPYCNVICGPSGSHTIFRHYFINGAIFEKTLLNIKCVF